MDTPIGTSAGRQKTLQALEEQTKLTPVDDPEGNHCGILFRVQNGENYMRIYL